MVKKNKKTHETQRIAARHLGGNSPKVAAGTTNQVPF